MGVLYGIVGSFDSAAADAMAARLRHRSEQLVHSRLNEGVLFGTGLRADQAELHQRDGLTLVGDIDIYNADEIAHELSVESELPEELLLAAWRRWGPDCLGRMNGDFALAIHDERDGSVTLARDISGARPVFFGAWGGCIVFASEYKALVALPDFSKTLDRQGLQRLQSRKFLEQGRTLLHEIDQVPAGSWMRIQPGLRSAPTRYWSTQVSLQSRSLADHAAEIRRQFIHAMERRIRGDDTYGIAVSGGIDSLAMVAAARQIHPDGKIRTFSVGDAQDDPELRWASRAADLYRTEHTSLVVSTERLKAVLPKMVWHLEAPIARTETFLAYQLAEEASKTIDRLIGGYAADGVFGGMPKHRIPAIAGRLGVGRKTLSEVYSYSQTGIQPKRPLARFLVKAYFRGKTPPVPSVIGAQAAQPLEEFPNHGPELLNEILRAGTDLAPQLWMAKVDRPNAAFGLSYSSPFFDPELIGAAFTVPSHYKHSIRTNKLVFREAVATLLPEELATRPKYAQRIRESAEFCDVLEDIAQDALNPAIVQSRGIFSPAEVSKLMKRPADGRWPPEHAMRIWTLVLTELWMQIFLDGNGESPESTESS